MPGHFDQNGIWVEDPPGGAPDSGGGMAGYGTSMAQATFSPFRQGGQYSQAPNWAGATGWPGAAATPGPTPLPGTGRPPGPMQAGANPAAGVPTAPTYAPNTAGRGTAPGGIVVNPAGNWQNPQLAMGAALQSMGISPTSNLPFVKDIMSRANDIIQSLIPQIGQQGIEAGSPQAAQLIMDQVKRAFSGGQVFATGDQRTQNMNVLQGLGQAGQAVAGSLDPSTGVLRQIASMLQDPNATTNLLQSILNGGAAPEARPVLARSLASMPLNYQTMQYNNPNAMRGPNGQLLNILDMIMNGTLTDPTQYGPAPSFLPAGG
jgi:hypothetical protein